MIDTVEFLRKIQKNATNRSIVITFLQYCFIQISDSKVGRITFSKAKLTIYKKDFPQRSANCLCKIFSKHLLNDNNIDIGMQLLSSRT